ncbi:T9SS type A sorting domain-containing protein [Lacinutrix chionoecetis]
MKHLTNSFAARIFRLLTFLTTVFISFISWSQTTCTPPNNPVADIVLTQDYSANWDANNPDSGSIQEYRPAPGAVDNMLIDGYDAFWVFQNNGQYPNDPTTANPANTGSAVTKTYPIQLYQQSGTTFRRARIKGYTSLTSEWGPSYLNGTAFLARQSNNITVEEIRADRVWDGLRSSNSEDTTFRNCWISNIRDDSVENDQLKSVTLENCLFENAFVGISMRPVSGDTTSDGTGKQVTMDNVHIYLTPYWYTDAKPHDTATIFKTSSSYTMPKMLITNCVFGWEVNPTVNNPQNITNVLGDIDPNSGNNVALWMSLEPVPSWFYDENVLPSSLFTTKLTGQAAINFADNDKAAFKAQWISDCRPLLDGDTATLSVNNTSLSHVDVAVYPNPVTDIVNIRIDNSPLKKLKTKVLDIKGKTLFQKEFFNTNTPSLSLKQLASGMYFVQIEGEAIKSTVKIIKQ